MKLDDIMAVKEPILPVINKNSFHERHSNLSLLEELLEKGASKVTKSHGRKNLKILHF